MPGLSTFKQDEAPEPSTGGGLLSFIQSGSPFADVASGSSSTASTPEELVAADAGGGEVIQINFDPEREQRKALAAERLRALAMGATKASGNQDRPQPMNSASQARTFEEDNPEYLYPSPLAMAYQGTLAPTVNPTEIKGALAGAALDVVPAVVGTAAGAAAAVATGWTGPGAIVAGGAAGGGAAILTSLAQEKVLKALGVWDKLQDAIGEAPAPAQIAQFATHFMTFYPGRPTALAGVISRKLAGETLKAAEKKALTEAAGRAALSAGVGTAVNTAATVAQGGDVTPGGVLEDLLMFGLMNKAGPLGRFGEHIGGGIGGKVRSEVQERRLNADLQKAGLEKADLAPDAPQVATPVNLDPAATPGAAPVGEAPPAEPPPAAGEPQPPEQAPLPDKWGARPGQVHHNFVELGYDARKAIIETTKTETYVPETFEQTSAKADQILELTGSDPKAILGTELGNSQHAIHALNVLTVRAAHAAEQAILATGSNPSEANLLKQAAAMAYLESVARPADEARRAMGRGLAINRATLDARGLLKKLGAVEQAALNIQRARNAASKKQATKDYNRAVADTIDRDRLKRVARMYKDMPPESRSKFAANASIAHRSRLFELYVNGLMSVRTAVTNAVGNLVVAPLHNAALLMSALNPFGNVTLGEIGFRLKAGKRVLGFKDYALIAGVKTQIEGQTAWAVAKKIFKLEADWTMGTDAYDTGYEPAWGSYQGIQGPELAHRASRALASADKVAGRVIRLPTDTMRATDGAAKAFHFAMELDGLSYREALKQNLVGDAIPEFMQRVRDDAATAKPKMTFRSGKEEVFFRDAARSFARRATLSEQNWWAETLTKAGQRVPLINYIQPFKLTPMNIMKTAWHFSPGPAVVSLAQQTGLVPKTRTVEITGGRKQSVAVGELQAAIDKGGHERELALNRIALGSAIMAGTYMKALAGNITGDGPADKTRRATMFALGWLPYSIRAGDTYVSFSRIDPVATIVGTAATAAEIHNETGKPDKGWAHDAARLSTSAAYNFLAKPMLQGPNKIMDAVFEHNDHGADRILDILSNMGATVAVPSATLKDTAAALDNGTLRDDQELLKKMKARIPGLRSENVPGYRRNRLTGEPSEAHYLGEGTFGLAAAILSPFQVSQVDKTPLGQAVLKLDNFSIGLPDDHKMVNGVRIDYTDAEFDRLIEKSGKSFYRVGQGLVRTSEFQGATKEEKASLLRTALAAARKDAQEWLESTTRVASEIAKAKQKRPAR